jgi:hypothetical protein
MAQKLLIQGSSWTVGAYERSSIHNSDSLVPGGIAELLATDFTVTNISVRDDFNLGSLLRLQAHLKTNSYYDKILICQNDPLRDLVVLRSTDHEWRKQFALTVDSIFLNKISTITKLIAFLLEQFYEGLGKLSIPVYVFAGPSCVNRSLAENHGLHVIESSWTEVLVPGVKSTIETSAELDYAHQLLQKLFLGQSLKYEFIEYADSINQLLSAWSDNKTLFAYHHPTALGNHLFYEYLIKQLQEWPV